MILVVAADAAVAASVVDELEGLELPVSLVSADELTSEQDEDDGDAYERGTSLFELAFERQATGIVLVESLGRLDQPAARASRPLLEQVISATNAPGVSWLGLVTSREASDDAVQHLQRSGMAYTVWRCQGVFELTVRDAEATGNRQVLVPAELDHAVAEQGLLAAPELARQVAEAIAADEGGDGAIHDLAAIAEPVSAAVCNLGAQVLLLPSWRVKLNAWIAARVVQRHDDHLELVRVRLGRGTAVPAAPRRDQTARTPSAAPSA